MKRNGLFLFGITGMLLLIFDSKTALLGASEGVSLCIRTVIPTMFPFFVLSYLLTQSAEGFSAVFLRKLCRLPQGTEGILVVGLLGGYPVGAKAVADRYRAGALSEVQAKRMLGFCSNCGPSFLFGIVGTVVGGPIMAALLWFIHMISAIGVGFLLPSPNMECSVSAKQNKQKLGDAVTHSLQVLMNVCGWIILARTFVAFLDRWFLWAMPDTIRVIFVGLLELANGCVLLRNIPNEAARLLTASGLVSFGGLCVAMQTLSVTDGLGLGSYIPGKMLQTMLSLALTGVYLLGSWTGLLVCLFSFTAVFWLIGKKDVAFSYKAVYNERNLTG